MEAYSSFAQVYDTFMDNVPYEDWCHSLTEYLHQANIRDGLVLDLGCGTGKMTRLLSKQGYDMIGVDESDQMLMIAREKPDDGILYLCQDMREFELYGTVRAVVSVCDCMNYLVNNKELVDVMKLVNNYLDPGGLFIFDMNTSYKYETLLADHSFSEAREDCSFIWDNFYEKESGINEYDLTLFVQQGDRPDSYTRFDEVHYQRNYTIDEIKQAVKEANMELLHIYDAYTGQEPGPECDRISVIARERGK